jgi:hypothetical protein
MPPRAIPTVKMAMMSHFWLRDQACVRESI